MKKTKKIIPPLLLLVAASGLLIWGINYYQEKNQPSIKVCPQADNCKLIYGASIEDLDNRIGYPAEHHRGDSLPRQETQEDFLKGYFDELTFYFTHKRKVFFFINAKIHMGFSEDGGELVGADAKSFELIDANFSRDKDQVWGRKDMDTRIAYVEIVGAHAKSFTPLDFPYAKDKLAVYYLNRRLEGADPDSFRITENKMCGQDKLNFYKDGQVAKEADCQ